MTLPDNNKRPIRTVTLAVTILLLASGIYILAIALAPAVQTTLTDPVSNSTVDKIASTSENITENRLYIPKIDISLPYQTGNESVMEQGAWWRVPENGNPKDGGNFVLSAHRFVMGLTPQQTLRKSPFYSIDKLRAGDELIVDYEQQRYTYIIEEIFEVKPDAIEIEERTNDSRLTLYSCTLGGANDGRNVFIARPKK